MKKIFKKYYAYKIDKKGNLTANIKAFELIDESFILFKSYFNFSYGTIIENDNLISIHTGGWSDNEELIELFKETAFWLKYYNITARGGHYYFDTNIYSNKKVWEIKSCKNNK